MEQNDRKFSVKWAFGYANEDYNGIEEDSPEDIEDTLNYVYKENDDFLQIAVLYEYGAIKACHVMEIPEIEWIQKEFLQPIADNKPARYFDRHCSCDYEFVSKTVDENHIHLIITDKNIEEDPIVRFDEIISKDEFLQEMDRVFNEIYAGVDNLVADYGNRHNLSAEHRELLRTRLCEW